VKCFYFLVMIVMVLIAASCQGGKKARAAATKAITTAAETIGQNQQKTAAVKEKIEAKLGTDDIPDTIKVEIGKRMDKYALSGDTASEYVSFIKDRLQNKKGFRRAYKDSIKPKIIQLEQFGRQSTITIYKLSMIDAGLDWAKQNKFELGAFFGPGKFIIPDEKYSGAIQLFTPVIDSLKLFSNLYADVKRTAFLVTLGFADAGGFNPESEVYKLLADSLKNPAPEKAALNELLSTWRAQQIGNLLEHSLIKKKSTEFVNIDKVDFTFCSYGKGEAFPSRTITDYTATDPRRRVVLIYWSVLPD
jgi:hypothetical protein